MSSDAHKRDEEWKYPLSHLEYLAARRQVASDGGVVAAKISTVRFFDAPGAVLPRSSPADAPLGLGNGWHTKGLIFRTRHCLVGDEVGDIVVKFRSNKVEDMVRTWEKPSVEDVQLGNLHAKYEFKAEYDADLGSESDVMSASLKKKLTFRMATGSVTKRDFADEERMLSDPNVFIEDEALLAFIAAVLKVLNEKGTDSASATTAGTEVPTAQKLERISSNITETSFRDAKKNTFTEWQWPVTVLGGGTEMMRVWEASNSTDNGKSELSAAITKLGASVSKSAGADEATGRGKTSQFMASMSARV